MSRNHVSSPRRRLVALGLLVLGLGVLAWGFLRLRPVEPPPPRPVPRAERPVVLVTVDTTRADRLQPYGNSEIATPTFLRLADEGVLFESAYSVAPITLVAHTSILAGTYPPSHGVRNNGLHYVPDEAETLAEILGERGYRTAAFVSAAVLDARYNLDQGFEVYDDDLSAGRERHPRMVADRPAEATVESARAWLDGLEDGENFFLWVHFYDPHAAYSPPPPWRDRYRENLYDGEIAYMDAQLGELLEHRRLADPETLVMVIGDHGESLGEHGEQTHALLAYDSTLRVPFLARVPGGPAGMRVEQPVGQVDIVPTVLDLLDLPSPEGLPGESLAPLLEGRPVVLDRALYGETYLPFYTYGWSKLRTLRRGPWKWIDAPTPELYDLSRDPHELSNLAEQEPGTAHDLGRDLDELLAEFEDAERESSLSLDREAEEQLRSLGYLATGSRSDADGPRPDPKEMVDLHVALERSRRLIRDRLYPQAERELRRVLDRDPTNLAALVDLAGALAEQERLDDAVRAVERGLSVDPNYPRLHVLLAGFEARRGEREKALEILDIALDLDPRYLDAKLQKAAVLRQLRRGREARAVLDAALAEEPDSPRLLAVYAQTVDLPRGDLDAAQEKVQRALERDPFLVHGYRVLARIEQRRGLDEKAAETLRAGLERRPDDAELHGNLGLLLARRGPAPPGADDASAERHLREAIRLAGEFRAEWHVALGAWLAERGRYEAAEAEYGKVLAIEPDHPGALNNRAIALWARGELDEAEAQWRALVEAHPNHADTWNNLSALAVQRGNWAEAESAARRALAVDETMAEAWSNLGLALDSTGRNAEARAAYERSLEADAGYLQARFNLAGLLRREGETERAEKLLLEVVRDGRLVEAHLEIAELYVASNRPEEARKHWNAFLSRAPRDPRAEEIRRRIAGTPPAGRDGP